VQAAQLLINTVRSDKSVLNNLIKSCDGTRCQKKSNMKTKFFLKISDHQQSVAAALSRGLPHTISSAGGR